MTGIAISSSPPDSRPESSPECPMAALRLDAEAIVASYPGAAIIADGAGAILAVNRQGDILAATLAGARSEPLRALIMKCLASGCVQSAPIATTGGDDGRQFQVVAFCAGDDDPGYPAVLMLARETTLETNLTHALIDSRSRYKDLVACSSDFAWETDAAGNFCFISPQGGLGHTPAALNKTPARRLLHPDYPAPASSPFETENPIEDAELWLARRDGDAACMLISAVGVRDGDDRHIGSRGVCRDVTKARKMSAELAAARQRESLLQRIVKSMRDAVDPFDTLPVAAERTARAATADWCRIWLRENGVFKPAATWAPADGAAEAVFATLADRLERAAADPGGPGLAFQFKAAGIDYLTTLTSHHQAINGAICLAVTGSDQGWRPTDAELITGVADHLGVAIEQIVRFNELKRLSRIDHLTGLLNRRSFEHEVGQRLRHQRRSGGTGALFYLDLDHFKQVNDRFGHHHGDQVLRIFGDILLADIRVMDLAARLGGDEFALWLENTDEPGAAAKASHLLDQAGELAKFAGYCSPALSVSIGIAVSDGARPGTLEDLMVRADQAMYRAKGAGKAAFKIAPEVSPC